MAKNVKWYAECRICGYSFEIPYVYRRLGIAYCRTYGHKIPKSEWKEKVIKPPKTG